MKKIVRIIWLQIKYDWMIDTAYFSKNFATLMTSIGYSIFYLAFIEVIFNKIKVFAGYTKNESVFLFFITQVTYYLTWISVQPSTKKFQLLVSTGNLDFLLLRPYSALMQMMFSKIQLLATITWTVIPLSMIFTRINWTELGLDNLNILLGSYILLLGLSLFEITGFIMSCASFFNPDLKKIYRIQDSILNASSTPLQGYSPALQMGLSTILPIGLMSIVPASVILGKSDPVYYSILATGVFISFQFIRYYIWKISLKHYSSAGG